MSTNRNPLSPAADAARLPSPPSFRRAAVRMRPAQPLMLDDLPTEKQLDIGQALRRLHVLITRGETMTSQLAELVSNTSWPDGAQGDTRYRRAVLHLGHLAMAGLDADREALAALCRILDDLPTEPPKAA